MFNVDTNILTASDTFAATLDAVNDKVGMVTTAPRTGLIDQMVFRIYSITGTGSYQCRIEKIGTDGVPSGALLVAGATQSFVPSASMSGVGIVTFSPPVAVTGGIPVCAVINALSVGASNYMRVVSDFQYPGSVRGTIVGATNIDGAGWSKGRSAGISLRYTEGDYIGTRAGFFLGDLASQNYRTDTGETEAGNRFVFDKDVVVEGLTIGSPGGYGNSDNMFAVKIYNSSDVEVRSSIIDCSAMASTSAGTLNYTFSSGFAVTSGTAFTISIYPLFSTRGSTSLGYWSFPTGNAIGVCCGYPDSYMRSRASGSTWTNWNPSSNEYRLAHIFPICQIVGGGGAAGITGTKRRPI